MRFLLLSVACLFAVALSAQPWNGPYHALSLRALAADHQAPNLEIDEAGRTLLLELAYERRFSPYFAVNAPVKLGVIDIGEDNNPSILGADALLRLYPFGADGRVEPYVHLGYGAFLEESERGTHQLPVGLGINLPLTTRSVLSLQGEIRYANRDNRDNATIGVGYVFRFIQPDPDRDGLTVREDDCPNAAGPLATGGLPG